MRDSIKIIKWCIFISIIFMLLTYSAAVNSEMHFISLDSLWISNNFFITIFGGIFASMIVILIYEIQKYIISKTNYEQILFYKSVDLYRSIMYLKILIEEFINHKEWLINENLFDNCSKMIDTYINSIQEIDYVTFFHFKNSFMDINKKFKIDIYKHIKQIVLINEKLKLAISKTREDFYQSQLNAKHNLASSIKINSESRRIAQVMNDELVTISSSIILVCNYIAEIDNYCNKRFNWNEIKENLTFKNINDI